MPLIIFLIYFSVFLYAALGSAFALYPSVNDMSLRSGIFHGVIAVTLGVLAGLGYVFIEDRSLITFASAILAIVGVLAMAINTYRK